ncbi:SAM-dependent methyltransferase [Bradyrhizobium sp. SUTN9-2]|nr:SAM-dependent methyltransferase [Bradyrhizobium sp. SUTN9-2]
MMISPTLPAELKAALDGKLQGLSRSDAARRSQKISTTYRAGGTSGTIKSDADALAYALARMPATYAAVAASLNALTEIAPDLAPETLLDVGAGPGTASWAAAEAFPSLQDFTLLDANPTLSRLALELARDSSRLAECRYLPGDAGGNLAEVSQADLVIASYIIGELSEADQRKLTEAMWARARHALVVIEPGTPAGYARILALRQQLIAAGAFVTAPCPHERPCPLIAPDWCHFSQRLPRSQAHRQIKGAEVPFEDERFIYVALTRTPPASRAARVLAPPDVGKAEIAAKLCTEAGVAPAKVPRRDKAAYAEARRWRWGDAVMSES